jgi:hypothetical protein
VPSDATTVYVASYGDYLVKVAEEHGTTWQEIWSHPLNAEHRRKRGSPDVLYPGDVLHVPQSPSSPGPPATPPQAGPKGPPAPPAPWPYPPAPPRLQPSDPTWTCPDAICVCETPHEEPIEPVKHTVFFHDDASRRMPGARCRVTIRGVVLPDATQADGSGALEVDVPPRARSMLLEWAPSDTPIHPTLPYRRVYHLELEGSLEEGVRRRLEHIGVSRDPSLQVRIREFQAAYGFPADGLAGSVADPLSSYHDAAMLPPLPASPPSSPVAPLSPDVRPPSQGCVSAVADRDGDCHFSFRLLDTTNQPVANEPFVLAVGDGRELESTTDGDGKLEYGDVRAGDYLLRIRALAMHVPALRKEERLRPIVVCVDR